MKARQRIHERVLKRMTHVQRPRHVRRRDHDAVGLALAGWCEPAVRLPSFVDALLGLFGVVGFFHGSVERPASAEDYRGGWGIANGGSRLRENPPLRRSEISRVGVRPSR